MDPFAVLDVPPGAPPDVLAAAYRRMAKRWHPDRPGADPEAQRRMAEINAAYDLIRDGGWRSAQMAAATNAASTSSTRPGAAPRRSRSERGSWLPREVRDALGRELVAALHDDEAVVLVTPAATWASPRTVLAMTDGRLLWLSEDAVTQRVHSVALALVTEADLLPRRFRRHVATVALRTARGGRYSFAELRQPVAEELVERLRARIAAGRLRRAA